MTIRLPGWTWKDLGPDGGLFDQFDKIKIVLHTTEGGSLAGAEATFKRYPPHLGYDPRNRMRAQYISLDRHSYAISNREAEDDYVIQIEIVGFADQSHSWPDHYYENIANDIILPLENALKVPRNFLRFYRAGENGYILASKYSPIRLSNASWRNFSGWLGHQHAPNPDHHWDPGGFLMDKAFKYAVRPVLPADLEDDDMTIAYVRGDSRVPIPGTRNVYGDIVFMCEWDVQEGVNRVHIVKPTNPGFQLWQAIGRPIKQVPQAVLDAIHTITEEEAVAAVSE